MGIFAILLEETEVFILTNYLNMPNSAILYAVHYILKQQNSLRFDKKASTSGGQGKPYSVLFRFGDLVCLNIPGYQIRYSINIQEYSGFSNIFSSSIPYGPLKSMANIP